MVVGAFPVAKLGALILKQVSKPLANAVKRRAKNNPFFRTYICMPPAQFYHWAEVKMKMWSMNLGQPVKIPKLNEALAIDLGAELLGEGIMFIIAAGILIAEYVRSSRKEEQKEDERIAELARIQHDLKDLYMETAKQDAHIREIVRILRLKLPEISYAPKEFDHNFIPIHHRGDPQEDPEHSMFSHVKGWLWSAIDFIVPEDKGADTERQKSATTPNILQVVPAAPLSTATPSPTNSSQTSSPQAPPPKS